ncbi:hypothetical protein ACNAUL_12965 [Raoultella ornithinolytica]|uniref:Uncharacterized protein n=1 Tax=Klebsiella electrica TaxID=1259973 RepID=A0AAJ5UH59_9ENTR|nr:MULTISPECIES: hypothetical protein [Klebsiella]MCF6970383.1 hypothetical protein [Klebsiella variicola]MUC80166.1 hypothetical protein [Klebsiella pneumoniae]WBW63652.1 hypothetical protein OR613_12550 [Klebsiella electrica]
MEKRRMWTKKEIQFVRDNAGKIPVQQIADHLNRTRSAILSQVTRWGLSIKVESTSEHDRWLCRELYKEGLTIPVIAEKMELSRRVVSNIVFSECY